MKYKQNGNINKDTENLKRNRKDILELKSNGAEVDKFLETQNLPRLNKKKKKILKSPNKERPWS